MFFHKKVRNARIFVKLRTNKNSCYLENIQIILLCISRFVEQLFIFFFRRLKNVHSVLDVP